MPFFESQSGLRVELFHWLDGLGTLGCELAPKFFIEK